MTEFYMDLTAADILDVLEDTLHYPQLAQVIANMNQFDRLDLYNNIEALITKENNAIENTLNNEYLTGYNNAELEIVRLIKGKLELELDEDVYETISEMINEALK